MRYLLLVPLISTALSLKAWGSHREILDVGLINQGRLPYFSVPTEGLYIDILDEIGREVGIIFRYRFFPQSRIRHLMNHNLLDVEPGIAEAWRTDKLEFENSIYSHAILTSSEVMVYNPKNFQASPDTRFLMTLSRCSILGFSDLDSLKEKQSNDQKIITEIQLLQMLKNNRCDFAVFPEDVVTPHLSMFGLRVTNSIATFDLKLRLTQRHRALLPRINQAIEKMVSTGLMAKILMKYRGSDD